MLSELGVPVVAADLDLQANLTSMFLDEEQLEEIWETPQLDFIEKWVSPSLT